MVPHEIPLTEELRQAAGWVADRSTMVRVVEDQITNYTGVLIAEWDTPRAFAPNEAARGREEAAAFWLTLDAINFGSGWFPTLKKRNEPTGYRTIAAGVRRRFDQSGRWSATQLSELNNAELAQWLDQDPDHELIALMVASLHDLGANLQRLYGRSFAALVDSAGNSALTLVETLAHWRCFEDISHYDGRAIPFLKRAQIAAADLHRAGVAQFHDLDRLTMFADNLVPHVLRLDGILWFDPELLGRIERGELIERGSPEEVEIRACAVHAVALIAAAAAAASGPPVTEAQIDEILWNRGQAPEYKAVPRHRSRSTAY